MTLLRAAARTMLASYFVASGLRAVRDPEALVPAAEPLTDRVVPVVKKYAPAQIAGSIPEDPATLVRINGALQLVGGLALATGKGRRLGAALLALTLIPSTLAKHPFWTRDTEEERAADRNHFLKNVSLLGGVLLASRDTEGRPGLVYRAQKGGEAIARDTKRATKQLTGSGSDLVESALAGGSVLVGSVVATSKKAQKRAAKELQNAKEVAARQLAEAQKAAEERAKEVQKAADAAAKQAKKDAPKLAKQAKAREKEEAARQAAEAKQARRDAPRLAREAKQEAARQAIEARQAAKEADRQEALARKAAKRGDKSGHIELGEN